MKGKFCSGRPIQKVTVHGIVEHDVVCCDCVLQIDLSSSDEIDTFMIHKHIALEMYVEIKAQ